ncbi:MAG TPA: hypothetical protein GXX39_02325 [Syntrophothermus lipocalidus]|nr:hypothetical protein [Syntrophothermus lipocalidus]
MSRKRYISTDISLDPEVNMLIEEFGPFAGLLYTWLIPHCEDNGTMTGDPRKILLQVVPGIRSVTVDDIVTALQGMEKYGLITWNKEQGIIVFPESFYKYQSYIREDKRNTSRGHQRCSLKSTDNQRTSAQISEHQRQSPQNTASPSPSPLLTPSLKNNNNCASDEARLCDQLPANELPREYESTPAEVSSKANEDGAWPVEAGKGADDSLIMSTLSEISSKSIGERERFCETGNGAASLRAGPKNKRAGIGHSTVIYTRDFEEFWSVYPRPKEKLAAFKVWCARMKEGHLPRDMIEAAQRYREECRRKGTEEQFIKLPKTFLGPSKPFQEYLNADYRDPAEVDEHARYERERYTG